MLMDEWRRNEDTAARLRHVRAEKREALKSTMVPGITVEDWARFRTALTGDGLGLRLLLLRTRTNQSARISKLGLAGAERKGLQGLRDAKN